MKYILLIDDSKTILHALRTSIQKNVVDEDPRHFSILQATSYAEASHIIKEKSKDIYISVIDLSLPDCEPGEAVVLANEYLIPNIILTGKDHENIRGELLNDGSLDYVKKDSSNSIKYVTNFTQRILQNYNVNALVVDDSAVFRMTFSESLKALCINTLEAKDGKEALNIINDPSNDISLVLTDYSMPVMDGLELTIALRETYDKASLAIIALSASEDAKVLSEFIKEGANDYISKPHKPEELNVRVHANLDILELFQKTKDIANKDFLTGSYNRRYFFEASIAALERNRRTGKAVAVATLDIDHFKNVNDTYGHDIGDVAIQEIAVILDKTLRKSDLVARFGGEEYCILLENTSKEDIAILFEKIRANFEANVIKAGDITLSYTVSLGIAYGRSTDINELIKVSDDALYEAKDTGRNKAVIHTF